MPAASDDRVVVPRTAHEGAIPLIAVEGTAHECGRQYAEIAIARYPGYREYLDAACRLARLPRKITRLFEERAPYLLEVSRGMAEVAGSPVTPAQEPARDTCTSFGVSGSLTLDGRPISGQTKDTSLDRVNLYIVLRMRIKEGPTILVLCYPGELLGYGMWSTGMSIFRNSLFSRAGADGALDLDVWGLLTLAGRSVHEGVELARKHGLRDAANCLISDPQGESLSVEWNAGGVNAIPARNGIATHANHPEGEDTAAFEDYPDEVEKEDSRYRMHGLWRLLDAERGRLTPQRAMMLLADHTRYPRGICRHLLTETASRCTTAAVVAEPTAGKLHVVRGNPCANWPVTYTI